MSFMYGKGHDITKEEKLNPRTIIVKYFEK